MILVTVTVLLAAAAGVIADHRLASAQRAARRTLSVMLHLLVPFVSFVSFVHLP